MVATIIYTKEDLLSHTLFNTTKAKKLKESIRISWVLFSIVSLMLFVAFYEDNDAHLVVVFFTAFIYFLFFYPAHQWRYNKKKITETIDSEYANNLSEKHFFDISDTYLEFKNETYFVKVDVSEIETIYELNDYYIIYYKSQNSTIIPKRFFNKEQLHETMFEISKKHSIPIQKEINWKWSFFYNVSTTGIIKKAAN